MVTDSVMGSPHKIKKILEPSFRDNIIYFSFLRLVPKVGILLGSRIISIPRGKVKMSGKLQSCSHIAGFIFSSRDSPLSPSSLYSLISSTIIKEITLSFQ